jgi:cyclopropane-fatty-acyl-phospholipid synthase
LTGGFELMADRADIEFTYSLTDRIFRLSLGELADFSGAKYDGDFSLRLEEAPATKAPIRGRADRDRPRSAHPRSRMRMGTAAQLHPRSGRQRAGRHTVLGARGRPRRHDLDVHLYDAWLLDRESFGEFDAVASLGAFEHFCSVEEYRHGRQEEIYRSIFARIASVLPERGRLYMQTMVFGRNMIPLDEVDVHAPRDSDAWYVALMERQLPGSWLPIDQEQVVRCAQDDFDLVSSSNGLLDYIQTITEWGKRTGARSIRKTLLKLQLVPRWLTSTDFRLAFTSGVSANKVCFERELLDHCRMVFEKRDRRPGPSRRAFGTAIITSDLCLAQAAVGRNVSVCFRLLAEYL